MLLGTVFREPRATRRGVCGPPDRESKPLQTVGPMPELHCGLWRMRHSISETLALSDVRDGLRCCPTDDRYPCPVKDWKTDWQYGSSLGGRADRGKKRAHGRASIGNEGSSEDLPPREVCTDQNAHWLLDHISVY